ncbi:carboxypeptidase-like regulatory domain-containing protein [Sorangium sp. So ce117]|uniref:carboxypeptidase-like regulatory domain-containing protein n=1 Tax=Sorangium sp. So ce117 TaxID=3133277 RepID=UPI003F5E09A2
MPYLGFTLRDHATGDRLVAAREGDLTVLVPRRPSALPPLVESPRSSVRLGDPRLFFRTAKNPHADILVLDMPPGVFAVEIRARGYLPRRARVRAPRRAPIGVRLHRDVTYPFASGDTVILGAVVSASGAPLAGARVELIDPDPKVPRYRVPLNARGQFAVCAPAKRKDSEVTLKVSHPSGFVLTTVPTVQIHRINAAPLTTVP